MDVKSFYSSKELSEKIGQYLDSKDVAERFEKSAADLAANECLIPVLGTQGSGKSSFLNAILFGNIVLPVDADETTCIPTAVKYGDVASPEAYVVMSSGARQKVPCTEKGLADYVHQEKNPGNEKGVACIEIVLKDKLLEDGIVFVDLPGVGSITAANQKTTTEYLKKCTAAIFMLRTVPPITQSESIFIQGALPLMGHVFWVQNQWTDESKDEVQEGRDHNFKVLKGIAKTCRLPEETISAPDVVCVKHALDGRIKEDARLVRTSGIMEFRDAVVAFARDWRKAVFNGKKGQAIELLSNAVLAAERRREMLSGDVEAERERLREEKKKAEDGLDANSRIVREARDYLSDRNMAMRRLIGQECRKFAEDLRNGVRQTIDSGVVGGESLNRAFNDYLKRGHEDLFKAVQPEFLEVAAQLQQMLSGLQDQVVEDIRGANAGTGFSDKTQIHSTYSTIGGCAGALVGIKAGAAAGAAVGTAIGGPVGTAAGWIVGIGVGALSAIFGALCGSKAQEIHLERQKEEARRELFGIVSELETKERDSYTGAYDAFSQTLESAIRDWLRAQKDAVDARFKAAAADIEKPMADKRRAADEAAADVKEFNRLKAEMEKA